MSEPGSQEPEQANVVQVPNEWISGGPLNCSPPCWLGLHSICGGKIHDCRCLCHGKLKGRVLDEGKR